MRYTIAGGGSPVLEIALEAGEALFSFVNTMLWMEPGIEMTTNRREGFLAGLRRALSDYTFELDYVANAPAALALAPRLPGTILPLRLEAGQAVICRKEILLCAERSVGAALDPSRKLRSVKRDDGSLWLLSGPGTIFLGLAGGAIERRLADKEELRASAAHVAMLDDGVALRTTWLSGFANRLDDQDGFCLAVLVGPGRVLLQGAPVMSLADEIAGLLPASPS